MIRDALDFLIASLILAKDVDKEELSYQVNELVKYYHNPKMEIVISPYPAKNNDNWFVTYWWEALYYLFMAIAVSHQMAGCPNKELKIWDEPENFLKMYMDDFRKACFAANGVTLAN